MSEVRPHALAADGSEALWFATAGAWRRWLQSNHQRRQDAWLITYKKGAAGSSVGYAEALDEATCFGWVDGILRAATDQYYLQRWVQRRPGGNWTDANRQRARRLHAAGRMTEAGLAVLPAELREELGLSPSPHAAPATSRSPGRRASPPHR